MPKSRREFIKSALSIAIYTLTAGSGILYSKIAKAFWVKEYFSPGTFEDTLHQIFEDAEFIDSRKIKLSRLPRVAENGSSVPITVSSSLDNVERIYILVEKNPSPLSAEFVLSPAVETRVSARLKMAETSDVIVIIEAEGKLYRKSKRVKVTVGGCS
jgi:sulfur-oxidizing protein SoxY